MEHSDLGSGFQIAMNDLKIRGGGTILGASQSGHIAAVGYDLFLELMQEAISRLKGEPMGEKLDPEIHLEIPAYLPENYISDINQRLTAYRRLSQMTLLHEIGEFKSEMEDRFGELPEEAANLLIKIMLRILSIQSGVKKLDLKDGYMIARFSGNHLRNPSGLVEYIALDPSRCRLTPDHTLTIRLPQTAGNRSFHQVKNILKDIQQHVNP
jgi:transcription-repair coupling factor (superfamily II helicase)